MSDSKANPGGAVGAKPAPSARPEGVVASVPPSSPPDRTVTRAPPPMQHSIHMEQEAGRVVPDYLGTVKEAVRLPDVTDTDEQ
jgi:hypothetical protein